MRLGTSLKRQRTRGTQQRCREEREEPLSGLGAEKRGNNEVIILYHRSAQI